MITLKGNESRAKIFEFKLSTLLEITNAINSNLSEDELFRLFHEILEDQLNIGKAMVFLRQDNVWRTVLHFGTKKSDMKVNVERDLAHVRDITVMEMVSTKEAKSFDILIPVFNQKEIIAYVLLGDIDEHERRASPIIKHLPFIQTIANITSVAVENQRLIREGLRQERMKRELEMASEMQAMLLPSSFPNDKQLQVAALYKPHQEVGGDFYDVIQTSEDEIVFCVADVSGKGISAGILMANFQASLRASVQVGKNLEEIVSTLNDQVWRNAQGERFITLFLAKYSRSSRKLHYVNAAHPSPLLIHKGIFSTLTEGCIGLGMLDKLPFVNSGKVVVPHDSLLVFFTDGLTEQENEKGEIFDEDILSEVIRHAKYKNMKELNQQIFEALNEHKGTLDYHDDIALVSCRIL